MMHSYQDIRHAYVSKIIDTPCWNVRRGHENYVIFEFGRPHLNIRDPINSKSESEKVRNILSRRRITIVGDCSLTLYNSSWTLFDKKSEIVNSSNENEKISKEIAILDGQKILEFNLIGIDIYEINFEFGEKLVIKRDDENEYHLWQLCIDDLIYISAFPSVNFKISKE